MTSLYAIYKYPESGYDCGKEYIIKEKLTLNSKYEIVGVDMGQSFTYISLDLGDRVRAFNSVNFDIVDEFGELYDIWDDPGFNPYL